MNPHALIACFVLAGSASVAAAQSPAPAVKPPGRVEKAPTIRQSIRKELDAFIATLADRPIADKPPVWAGPAREAQALFDLALAFDAPKKDKDDVELLRDAAAIARFTAHINALEAPAARRAVPLLLARTPLREALALGAMDGDNIPAAYAVLDSIAARLPKAAADDDAATLIAAVCLVHDTPLRQPGISPPRPKNARPGDPDPLPIAGESIDPVEVVAYFRASRGQLNFDYAALPVQALVHVVDTQATPDELRWALRNFKGNQAVGAVYNQIVYDTAAFKFGKPKKVYSTNGYTLPNIRKVGGVCAEQAYFAAHAAKAIGVPSAYVLAEGSDVGHAYVGYLQSRDGSAKWNFDEGRYDEYEELRGSITDPQTGRTITDSELAMRGPLYFDRASDREQAVALLDGAKRLARIRPASGGSSPGAWPPPLPRGWPVYADAPLKAGVESEAALLRAAVARAPAYTPAWREVMALAGANLLNDEDKNAWAQAAMKAAGTRAPDFTADVLLPIIRSMKDAARRNRLFDWAAQEFNQRPDVSARARFEQANAYLDDNKQSKAWETLNEVIRDHANDGTVVIDALRAFERLLGEAPNQAAVQKSTLDLYAGALRRISKPDTMSGTFGQSSVYFRVGSRYAQLLEAAGNPREAERIRRMIAAGDE